MIYINNDNGVKKKIIENLLCAHKRIADKGKISDLIKLTKVILKLSKHIDNEILNLRLENGDNSTESPPQES